MMNEQLKACPHCGGTASTKFSVSDSWLYIWVECDKCGCGTRLHSMRGALPRREGNLFGSAYDRTVEEWNARVNEQAAGS